MSNQLITATSPYLLQHANNPVKWYQWGIAAFKKAKLENKPIFLSIGYSTCHWCHVMAHESFEDEKTAEILNRYFISIKVDREERPDIDSIYMSVCEAFTGSGGWPLSIFMTWDKKPFFAGTYFPPKSKYGMPSFPDLLTAIANKWNSDREELFQSADEIISYLKTAEHTQIDSDIEQPEEKAIQMFTLAFDKTFGGFGTTQKFPIPHNLLFLMLYSGKTGFNRQTNHYTNIKENYDFQKNNSLILTMVEKTLLQMRKGGIFDHIGYGFSRYSTDRYFLVPHFEKMLYDNALLIIAYSTAYSMTNNRIYLDTAQKTAEYIFREMTSDDGGFFSAQDADSDGIEGKYYTFSLDEIMNVLGKDAGANFANVFDITLNGNFDGVNIPNLLKSNALNIVPAFDKEIEKLYDYRKKRIALHLDDKILLSWNSLMIAALSMLYRVSHDTKYLDAAQKAHAFIEKNLCINSLLYTSFRDGKHSENHFLDDYAFYVTALIELYHSTLDSNYIKRAEQICNETIRRFADMKNGGFYLCENNNTEFFINPKETNDGAIPSGNSVMAYNLVRLYQITEKEEYQHLAKKQITYMSAHALEYPIGHSMFLLANRIYEDPPVHITIVMKDEHDLDCFRKHIPYFANIKIVSESKEYPLLNEQTTYNMCKNHMCMAPTNTIADLFF